MRNFFINEFINFGLSILIGALIWNNLNFTSEVVIDIMD